MSDKLRKGTIVVCDKGRCSVVGHVKAGHVVRDADGNDWVRGASELKRAKPVKLVECGVGT